MRTVIERCERFSLCVFFSHAVKCALHSIRIVLFCFIHTGVKHNSLANMEYSMEQRIKIIKVYWENKSVMEATMQKLEEIFGAEGIAVPKPDDIRAIEAHFLETGSILDEEQQQSSEEEYDEEEEEEVEEEEEEEVQRIKVIIGQNFYQTEPDVADR